MIIFGGVSHESTGYLNDVWALSFSGAGSWSQLTPTGTPPRGRYSATAVFDAPRDRMLILGGASLVADSVWALSLSGTPDWSHLVTLGQGPTHESLRAAIDAGRDRLLVLAGSVPDVFELPLNGAPIWSRVGREGDVPLPRFGSTWTFDAANDRALLHAGAGEGGHLNDVAALSFPSDRHGISISVQPPGSGTVTRSPSQECYAEGSSVTLTAVPGPGISFTGWSGDASGNSNPMTIVVNGSKTIFANFAVTTVACEDWTPLLNTGPGERREAPMIYDPIRHRMLRFGGFRINSGYFNDVWALSLPSMTWSQVATAGTSPAPRSSATAIYDPVRDRMIVFAGAGLDASFQTTALSDAWALSLSGTPTWSLLAQGEPPTGRIAATAVYDPVFDRMVVFGGGYFTDGPEYLDDTWALSLSGTPTWSSLGSSLRPPARSGHVAVYDPVHHCMVMHGGAANFTWFNDTWSLSLLGASQWQLLPTTGAPPSKRTGSAAIYDAARARMLLFGGAEPNLIRKNDTWALSLKYDAAWIPLAPDNPPTARSNASATFDPVGDQFVVFGGYVGQSDLGNGARLVFAGGNSLDLVSRLHGQISGDPNPCYPPGEQLMLTATPQPGYYFAGWTGDAGGMANPLPLTMDAHKTVIGTFASIPTAVEEVESISASLIVSLSPNPSRGPLGIEYAIAREGPVRLTVLDVAGRSVVTLVDETLRAGRHSAAWSGERAGARLPAGLYMLRLAAPDRVAVTRFAVIR
jgi:hypothetical protein